MGVITLVILATLAEAGWETLKMIWQDGKACVDRIGALVVSIIITFGTGVDVMSILGIEMKWKALGLVLTAILISRGSTFTHEIISRISNIKSDN